MKTLILCFLLLNIMNTTSAQDKYSSHDQAGIVASERAFANATSFLGIREGFLTFFADDAISFDAGLENAREYLLKGKMSNYPVKSKLLWMPEFGDISAAGDFGFLYGPWEYRFDAALNRKSLYGVYFSVWIKENSGLWKVFFDGGTNSSERIFEMNNLTFTSLSDSTELNNRVTCKPEMAEKEILNTESNFFTESENSNISAMENFLIDNATILSEGEFPINGKMEIMKFLNKSGQQKITGKTKGIKVAASGDMAFTYGTCKNITDKTKPINCYYARIWKQAADGEWKILIEVKNEAGE